MKRHRCNETRKTRSGRAQRTGLLPTAQIRRRGADVYEWGNCEDGEHRARVALFRAVLVQHIMDAKSRSNNPEKAYWRHVALHWLFDDQRGFRTVCELADLNPDAVRKKLHEARERGFIWRAGGEQKARQEKQRTSRKNRRAVLIELGLFPRLEERRVPAAARQGRRLMRQMGDDLRQLGFEFCI